MALGKGVSAQVQQFGRMGWIVLCSGEGLAIQVIFNLARVQAIRGQREVLRRARPRRISTSDYGSLGSDRIVFAKLHRQFENGGAWEASGERN